MQCNGLCAMLNQTTRSSSTVSRVSQVLIIKFYWCWIADSGHGGQTKDRDGDEADGYDEGLHLASIPIPLPHENLQSSILLTTRQLDISWMMWFLALDMFLAYSYSSLQLLHDILVKPLPPGCRLTAIFDVGDIRLSIVSWLTLYHSLVILGPFLVCLFWAGIRFSSHSFLLCK